MIDHSGFYQAVAPPVRGGYTEKSGKEEELTLKEWRAANGIKQCEFADMMDVGRVTVARWESKTRTPDLHLMRRIYDVTKQQVTPNDWILT